MYPFAPVRIHVAALLAACCLAPAAFAATEPVDLQRELLEMRHRMDEMERRHHEEIEALREELHRAVAAGGAHERPELSHEIERLADATRDHDHDEHDEHRDRHGLAAVARGPDHARHSVDVSLHALVAAGGASEGDETIAALQGGGHDPNRRGFTTQNVELELIGVIDEYLRGQANVVWFVDREGESRFELEEAFAAADVGSGVEVKAGQFFTELGRHNRLHPHDWDFVDQPFAWTRFFGPDGMRGQGARVAWRSADGRTELLAGSQNANGETMSSFVGTAEEEHDDHGHGGGTSTFGMLREREVRSLEDLVWHAGVRRKEGLGGGFDAEGGAWSAWGPNGAGGSSETLVAGLDGGLTWRSQHTDDHGHAPWVTLRAEWAKRRYDFDPFLTESGRAVRGGALDDEGGFAQLLYGFAPGWMVGARYGWFDGDRVGRGTLGLEDRDRITFAVTRQLSEQSSLRLQMNRDDSDLLGRVTSLWLQLEWSLGAHHEHGF